MIDDKQAEDRRLLRAFASLEGDGNFKTVMEWITKRRDAARANEGIKEDCLLRWSQGRAQFGTEIVDLAANARKTLQKMK